MKYLVLILLCPVIVYGQLSQSKVSVDTLHARKLNKPVVIRGGLGTRNGYGVLLSLQAQEGKVLAQFLGDSSNPGWFAPDYSYLYYISPAAFESQMWSDDGIVMSVQHPVAPTTLAASVSAGSTMKIKVTDPTNMTAYHEVFLGTSTANAEWGEVKYVSNDTLYFWSPIHFAHSAGDTVWRDRTRGHIVPINSWQPERYAGKITLGMDQFSWELADPETVEVASTAKLKLSPFGLGVLQSDANGIVSTTQTTSQPQFLRLGLGIAPNTSYSLITGGDIRMSEKLYFTNPMQFVDGATAHYGMKSTVGTGLEFLSNGATSKLTIDESGGVTIPGSLTVGSATGNAYLTSGVLGTRASDTVGLAAALFGKVPTSTTVTIAGTANQITSSAGAQDLSANRTWTLSTPQDIATASTPTWGGQFIVANYPQVTITSNLVNFNTSTMAQAVDTSAIWSFVSTSGKPLISMRGPTGKTIAQIDTVGTGQFVTGDIVVGSGGTTKIVQDGVDGAITAGQVSTFELGGDYHITSRNDIVVDLDNDANVTNASFRIKSNNSSTTLFSIDENGTIKTLNSSVMEGDGLGTVDTVNWTAMSAAVSATNFSNTATGHLYEFSGTIMTTTTGNTVTASVTISYNNGTAVTYTSPTIAIQTAGSDADIRKTFYVASGTPTIATNVSGALGTGVYAVRGALKRIW